MNQQKYPQFEQLQVLRTEALCSIRDRAFDMLPLYLKNFSDGIISGCNLSTNSDSITLNEGIIKHGDFLYLIKTPMNIEYQPTDQLMILKMIFDAEMFNETFIERNISLELSTSENISFDEMELCRFKLKRGAVLRSNYVDFLDRATEFDTINTINSPFAAVNHSTLSPFITKSFAEEVKEFDLDSLDFQFCFNALTGQTISAAQIIFYIEHKLKIELTDRSNQSLYDHLAIILNKIKSGNHRQIFKSNRRRRQLIVD